MPLIGPPRRMQWIGSPRYASHHNRMSSVSAAISAKNKQSLADQAATLEGKRGALLRAVSAADGRKLAQYEIDSPPVFDGMAAAAGRLYMSTVDGEVLCYKSDK